MPLISIIIPTYNRRPLLSEAIGSVLQQTQPDWELIVVDDASEDDTSEYVDGIDDPRVRSMRLDRNSGQSAARREGTAAAQSPHLMFLDDDDLLRRRALERLHGSLTEDPGTVAAVGANVEFDARGHRRRVRHPRRPMKRILWPELLWGWSATPSRVLVRREAMDAAGSWDPAVNTAHDTDLWLRMSIRGPFAIVPAAVVDKRAHEGQSRPEDQFEIQMRFRQAWFESLASEIKKRAAPVLEARGHTLAGERYYRAGEMAKALREFTSACTAAPLLLRSPLVRPYMTRDVAKAAAASAAQSTLGPRRTATIRTKAKLISGKLLKRDPGGHRVMRKREPRPPANDR